MKRTLLRKILGGLSFTTALFVFQACYGTPQDFGGNLWIGGEVRSKTTGALIMGIKVMASNSTKHELTDFSGRYLIETTWDANLKITFEDIDGIKNAEYLSKDTIIYPDDFSYNLNVHLENK